MTIFVTAPFEAEIPRFSDQSQRNSAENFNKIEQKYISWKINLLGAVFGLKEPPDKVLLDLKGEKSYLFYPCDKIVYSKKS